MRFTYYPEEDAIYVKLTEEPFAYGKDLDDRRHINCSADGEVIGVEFLDVSEGVDLEDIPEKVRRVITPLLEQRNFKVYA